MVDIDKVMLGYYFIIAFFIISDSDQGAGGCGGTGKSRSSPRE